MQSRCLGVPTPHARGAAAGCRINLGVSQQFGKATSPRLTCTPRALCSLFSGLLSFTARGLPGPNQCRGHPCRLRAPTA